MMLLCDGVAMVNDMFVSRSRSSSFISILWNNLVAYLFNQFDPINFEMLVKPAFGTLKRDYSRW